MRYIKSNKFKSTMSPIKDNKLMDLKNNTQPVGRVSIESTHGEDSNFKSIFETTAFNL